MIRVSGMFFFFDFLSFFFILLLLLLLFWFLLFLSCSIFFLCVFVVGGFHDVMRMVKCRSEGSWIQSWSTRQSRPKVTRWSGQMTGHVEGSFKDPWQILGNSTAFQILEKDFFLNPGTLLYEDFWRIVESECSRREQMLQDCLQDRLGNIGTPPRRLVVNAVVSMLEIQTRCRLPPLGSFAYFIHRHRIWGGRPMAPPVPSHVSRDPCRTHMS